MKLVFPFLFIMILFLPSLQAQRLKGEVARFTFDDGELTDRYDSYERALTKGELEFVEGPGGSRALQFNSAEDKLIFPGLVNTYLRKRGEFTLSFYFRSDDLNNTRSLMSKRLNCDDTNYLDVRVGREIYFEFYDSHRPDAIQGSVSASISDRGWHHYLFMRSGYRTWLYVDGQLVDQNRSRYPVWISDRADFVINDSPCIGSRGLQPLKGALDDVRVFARILRKKDILKIALRHPLGPSRTDSPTAQERRERDQRMEKIFGFYLNKDEEMPASLELEPLRFVLKISRPIAYPNYEELIYSGPYAIRAGQLILKGKNIQLYRKNAIDDSIEEKTLNYDREWTLGDVYGEEVTIDLFAFDTRLKLVKQ
ncbi:MAG: LamG domain-containing protein [Bacteroidota bacterium]